MRIPCLGKPCSSDVVATGILSGSKPEECRVDISLFKAFKIPCFNDQRQCSVSPDPEKTAEFFNALLVFLQAGYFFYPFVEAFDLCSIFLVRDKILIERLPV